MPESRGHNGGDENNIESPQIAEILKFRRNFFEILAAGTTEEIAYAAGFNEAVEIATHIAQQEEKRVRAIIERSDGVCLDTEEERRRFLNDLYGAGERDN